MVISQYGYDKPKTEDIVTEKSPTEAEVRLTPEEQELLLEGSADKNGMIVSSHMNDGISIYANSRLLNERNPRSQAKWVAAIERLVAIGLLKDESELFPLTASGYQAADQIRAIRDQSSTQTQSATMDDNDAISILEQWLEPMKERIDERAFNFSEVDAQAKLPGGTSANHLETAAKKFDYVVERRGQATLKFKKGSSWYPSPISVTNPRRFPGSR